MSKITLEPNASGTGTFSIVSPNSNTNRTLNLPDESGVLFSDGSGVPGSAVTGQLASSNMPAGSVLQIQHTIASNDILSTTSSSYSDIPDLDVAITPQSTSSNILIFFTVHIYVDDGSGWQGAGLRLLRDNTVVFTDSDTINGNAYGYAHNLADGNDRLMSTQTKHVFDSPSTTSPITYKVQGAQIQGGGRVSFNQYGGYANITVMEIAG